MTQPRVTMFVLNDMRLDSRVRREAEALAAAGWSVTVRAVATDATAHEPRTDVDGYTIIRTPMLMAPVIGRTPGPESAPIRLHRRVLAAVFAATRYAFGGTFHLAANWRWRWRAWGRRVMENVEPSDVWHAHDLPTLPIALACADRFGGAVVYDSHEIFTEAGSTSRLPAAVRYLLRRWERAWARRADLVLTVNASLAEVLGDWFGRDDIAVVHNCASPTAAHSPLRAALGVDLDIPLILYHGSVTVGRGLETLIEAMLDPLLAGARLAIMGYGPLRPRLERLAAASSASDRIRFLPPVSPDEVTAWVSGADVAAIAIEPTTLNHRLSSPNKLFEALAAGVPVVGPDFVEFRRIIRPRSGPSLGRLYAHHEARQIAAAIHSILALSPAERSLMRDRCRAAAARRWNWQVESARLRTAYAGLRVAAPAPLRKAGQPATAADRIVVPATPTRPS